MRTLLLYFSILLMASCKTSQSVAPPPQEASLGALCECQNSKGQRISAFIMQKQKENNISNDRLPQFLSSEMQKEESWLINDFFQDQQFMQELGQKSELLGQLSEGEVGTQMAAIEQEYPACYHFMIVAMMVMKSPAQSGN
ncbi:MAG: hypothetical protein AAF798_22840 [Bacteroidota bacterium]